MLNNYFLLLWCYFLDPAKRQTYPLSAPSTLSQQITQEYLNDKDDIHYLYLLCVLTFDRITHRRNKPFSFSPKTKIDMLFLYYIENKRCLNAPTMYQKILLNKIFFKKGNSYYNFNGIGYTGQSDVIVLEVSN